MIHKNKKKTRLPTDSCPNNSVRAHTQAGPDTAGICSLQLSSLRIRGLSKFSRSGAVNQCSKFRAASCHCVAPCPCFASCNSSHDPFIVRSAQTRPPFTGFTQLAHPSRCPRSTLTTVCFCILQTCNVVVVLKQRLASFQHLCSFSP